MTIRIARTSEHVGAGHPDKFCDQLADAILDESLRRCGDNQELRKGIRTAVECLVKDNLVIVSGETRWPSEVQATMMCGGKDAEDCVIMDVHALARDCWKAVGYGTGEELAVVNNLRSQSVDIAKGGGTGVDAGGAGDQGIMVGYATDETPEMMPLEWVLARDICMELNALWSQGTVPWLRSDCKSQVTLNADQRLTNVIIAVQHAERDIKEMRREVFELVLLPLMAKQNISGSLILEEDGRFRYGGVQGAINGTGKFTIGGSIGDAGVVGRKIVVDAYGPRVPVGGGAYSGKDPSKVDRSAAYMARHIAKTVVTETDAKECMVQLAYGIGQLQPEMVSAVTNGDVDVSRWVQDKFKDLSQGFITDYLSLRNPQGWSYRETAAYGHYGRNQFPWEKVGQASKGNVALDVASARK
ncbi:MAG TPA: methionine adenosyltransferase [Thermoanaerobaculia bacterium]|nr:methionine adenosyltransferase [Thermoanaerobaculia bacterium]